MRFARYLLIFFVCFFLLCPPFGTVADPFIGADVSTLAPPSTSNLIMGKAALNKAQIRKLMYLSLHQILSKELSEDTVIDREDLTRLLDQSAFSESGRFRPIAVHFFFHEPVFLEKGLCIRARLIGEEGLQDYYLVLNLPHSLGDGDLIESVLTEEEYSRFIDEANKIAHGQKLLSENKVSREEDPKMRRLLRLANEKGLELNDADLNDLEDPFFANVTFDLLENASQIGLDVRLLNRIYSPDRVVEVEIPVVMDDGRTETFPAYRVLHNGSRGAGKGGLRFHPAVTRGMVRALATDMTWKNAVVGIPYGGAKGGIAVAPDKLSKKEIERLCRGFVRALLEKDPDALGVLNDIPAPDVGSTAEYMAWIRDEFEKIKGVVEPGVITGKPVTDGGSEGRTKATGYGVFLSAREGIKTFGEKLGIGNDITRCSYAIQGAGNVSFAALKSLFAHGCRDIRYISDVSGAVFMPDGMSEGLLEAMEQHLEAGGLLEDLVYSGVVHKHRDVVLTADVDVLMPSALQNQITADNAEDIKAKLIVEGANGPTTPEADRILKERGVVVIPDILANAGGVTVSYFEWLQNIQNEHWDLVPVDKMLQARMKVAYDNVYRILEAYGESMRSAAMFLALMRVSEAELARDSELTDIFGKEKPYFARTELFSPDTFEQVNQIVQDKRFVELIAASEHKKQQELEGVVGEIEQQLTGQKDAVLINGPVSVGKAYFAHGIRRHLAERGVSSTVVHIDIRDPLDLLRLINGGALGVSPEERTYYTGGAKKLTWREGDVLVIEGLGSYSPRILGLLEDEGFNVYKIFVNTAPSMKLRDNYPYTSLAARVLREVLDGFLTRNKRPSESVMRLLRAREEHLREVYPQWGEAERSVEAFLPYELPFFKREVWEILLDDIQEVSYEKERLKDKKYVDSEYAYWVERTYEFMLEVKYLLDGVEAAPREVGLPEDAMISQFLGRGREEEHHFEDFVEMRALAKESGMLLARPVLKREYTLVALGDMYSGREDFEADKLRYASRFKLERIMPDNPDAITSRVLGLIRSKDLDPATVIVQLPETFAEEQKAPLVREMLDKAEGIRFITTDIRGLRSEPGRERCRRDIYAMMLLARNAEADTRKGSSGYRMLRFMVEKVFSFGPEGVDEYIDDIINNNPMGVVQRILSYRPVVKYPRPEYDAVLATLVSA